MPTCSPSAGRLAWFRAARFGMFVHFGCYAAAGRGEQIMLRDLIPAEEYARFAADFDPHPGWADELCAAAKGAGATYIVLTTRHHDGYCLFDTATHDFNAVQTGPGRDLIDEYVAAARAAGLRVGFYYSVHTWRYRGFWDPAGYPDDLPLMRAEMYAQVEELMSNYGAIDLLWYDAPAPPGHQVPGNFGWHGTPLASTPAAFYDSARVNARVRELQPHILINDRSGLPEDFGTPEQHISAADGGRMWEACMTLNFAPGWGYLPYPLATKTPGQVLWHLLDCVRQGGNFLFNVGPKADGSLAARDRDFLAELGAWMQLHRDAVFTGGPSAIQTDRGQGVDFHYGMFTEHGTTAWLTLFYYPPDGFMLLNRIAGGLKTARLLTTGEELTVERISNGRYKISGLPLSPPATIAPVIELAFARQPREAGIADASWLDGAFDPDA